MSRQMKQLRKYYLMTDESMQKLKDIANTEKLFSMLDRQLKKVLYNKRLTGYNKFLLYSQLLGKLHQLRKERDKKFGTQSKANRETKATMTSNDLSTQTAALVNEIPVQTFADEQMYRTPANTSIQSSVNETAPNVTPINETIADTLAQNQDMSQGNDQSYFLHPANTDRANPFASPIDYELPNLENLTVNEKQLASNYDPKFTSKLNWSEIDGELEAQTSPQKRRLSAAAMASASKKSAKQIPVTYDEEDGAVGGYTNESDDPNLTIIDSPVRFRANPDHINMTINGIRYDMPAYDRDDFGEFAAEEFKKYPNLKSVSPTRFASWKKRKEKEYSARLREERRLIHEVKKREEENSLAKEMEEVQRQKNAQQNEVNWNAHHYAAASATSTPKTKTKTPPRAGTSKAKTPPRVDPNQISVAEIYKKTKNIKTPYNKQSGDGKKMRWIQLK